MSIKFLVKTAVCVLACALSTIASESLDIPVSSGGNTSVRHLNYFAPSGLNNPPLVVLMHGAQGNGNNLAEAWGWDSVAIREKFVVATPSSNGSFWDIGGSFDVDFIKAIIDTMARRYNIDRNRVYATGWSMGGMMSYYLACHEPELIAAIGPSSGYLIYGQSGCSSARNVPIYHIHGIWDDFVKYSDLHAYLNNFWLGNFGCPATPDSSNPGLGGTLLESWEPCSRDGKNSEIYLESYWKGHGIGAEEAEVFWNFLHKYSLDAVPLPAITLYERTNHRGHLAKMTAGSYTHVRVSKIGLPDSALSSVKIPGGMTVEFFDNDDFQNPLATYTSDAADISGIKDRIRAIRITEGPVIPPAPGASFYQFANYSGLNTKLTVGDYTLADLNAAGIPDNAVSSMRVDSGLVVALFDGDNFQSLIGEYDSSQPDFASIGASGKLTSVRIYTEGTVPIGKSTSAKGIRLSTGEGVVTLHLDQSLHCRVEWIDLVGRKSKIIQDGLLVAGDHRFGIMEENVSAIQVIRVTSKQGAVTQRVLNLH